MISIKKPLDVTDLKRKLVIKNETGRKAHMLH